MTRLLTSLIGITVIESIFEMLMPKGNIKKIALFVMGFALILAVLSPLADLMFNFKNKTAEKWGGMLIEERY